MATPTKSKTALVAMAAVVLASIAAYMVYNYLGARDREARQAKTAVQQVVVAATDIPFGTRINSSMLKTADWPVQDVPQGSKSSPQDLEGRFAVSHIAAGSPVIEASLAPVKSDTGVLSFIIPSGDRAITVAVNDVVGVAGFILPNAVVDVIATVNMPYRSKADGTDVRISKIILQNVKVLAVGQILEEKEGKPVTVPTVTLDVKPDQAEKLALASENKVQLVLKHVGDSQEVATKGATISSLLGLQAPARPAAKKAVRVARVKIERARANAEPEQYVEIIKGSTRTIETFK
jgi:pilus assembly protein CpaB